MVEREVQVFPRILFFLLPWGGVRGSLQVCCSTGKENGEVQVKITILHVTNPLPGSLPAGPVPNTEKVRRG